MTPRQGTDIFTGVHNDWGGKMRYERPAIEKRVPVKALMAIVISIII